MLLPKEGKARIRKAKRTPAAPLHSGKQILYLTNVIEEDRLLAATNLFSDYRKSFPSVGTGLLIMAVIIIEKMRTRGSIRLSNGLLSLLSIPLWQSSGMFSTFSFMFVSVSEVQSLAISCFRLDSTFTQLLIGGERDLYEIRTIHLCQWIQ